jgi:ATPases with chaperone activity, ATP-binding subunit
MNFDKFTIKSQEALQKSAEIAMSRQQQAIEPGHILKAILETDENVSEYLFKKLNINGVILGTKLEKLSIVIRGYQASNLTFHQMQIQHYSKRKKNSVN